MRCPHCGREIVAAAALGRLGVRTKGAAKRRSLEHYRRMAQLSSAKRRATKQSHSSR